jgi:hypothetical protein
MKRPANQGAHDVSETPTEAQAADCKYAERLIQAPARPQTKGPQVTALRAKGYEPRNHNVPAYSPDPSEALRKIKRERTGPVRLSSASALAVSLGQTITLEQYRLLSEKGGPVPQKGI